MKELWEIQPDRHQQGLVIHTAGWPLALRHLRRLVPVPHGEQPGRDRLRGRAGLPATPTCTRTRNSSATRRIPRSGISSRAASASCYGARAISAGGLQSLPKLVFPGRLPDRRRRRLSQRLAHQGQPRRDQVGHARGGGGVRRGEGRPQRRRARRVSRGVPRELAARRAAPRAQLQAVDEQGALPGHADGRASTRSCSAERRRGRCTTTMPTTRRCS